MCNLYDLEIRARDREAEILEALRRPDRAREALGQQPSTPERLGLIALRVGLGRLLIARDTRPAA